MATSTDTRQTQPVPRFEPSDLSLVSLDDLVVLLDDELERDVRRAIIPVADDELYVLALCVSERGTSIYVTANTEEHVRDVATPHGSPEDPYWRWDCAGDWAVIAASTLQETNRFLADLERAHEAWLWSFDPDERQRRSRDTWPRLTARLVDCFHDALRRLQASDGLGAHRDSCVVCLLSLDDPDFTKWSATQLNPAALVDREFVVRP